MDMQEPDSTEQKTLADGEEVEEEEVNVEEHVVAEPLTDDRPDVDSKFHSEL